LLELNGPVARLPELIATALWVYAIFKVFVFDLDQYAFQRIWPAGGWIVTYRFFVLLALASAWALILKRWAIFFWMAYFALFPLILVVWWIPRAVYKSRSWAVVMAILNVITTLVQDFNYSLVTKSTALIAIAVIIVGPNRSLTLIAGALLLGLLLVTYVRTIAIVLRPSRFVTGQQRAIDKIVGSQVMTGLWSLSEDLKDPKIVKFDSGQMTKFTTAVTMGVLVHRALLFWAAQLDSYRKGSAPQVFNLLSYLWLFVQSVIAFALINYALYRGDPSAFVYTTRPQLFDFFHYAINLILNSSVTSPQASSQVAVALGDLVRLSGPVVLVTILATFVLSTKQSRQDEQMKDSIRRIKDRSRQFEAEFESQYEVSIAEAIDRLKQVPGALVGIAAWLSRQIPAGFEGQ
jgi:hypothetical protein